MMNYRVVYASSLIDDLKSHIRYLKQEHVSSITIERWYKKLLESIDDLESFPNRYPVDASQSQIANEKVRKMSFGNYLLFFYVDQQNLEVHVSAFIHGAQDR